MEQKTIGNKDFIVTVWVGELATSEVVFGCDPVGKVFAVASGEVFPVLRNGSISRKGRKADRSELLSIIDPQSFGMRDIRWTNRKLTHSIKLGGASGF